MRHHHLHPKTETQAKSILHYVLGGIVVLLLLLQVIVSNRLTTLGARIWEVESDIQNISSENTALSEKTVSASSLMAIKSKAALYGFTQTVTPRYFSADVPVAFGLK